MKIFNFLFLSLVIKYFEIHLAEKNILDFLTILAIRLRLRDINFNILFSLVSLGLVMGSWTMDIRIPLILFIHLIAFIYSYLYTSHKSTTIMTHSIILLILSSISFHLSVNCHIISLINTPI